MVLGVKWNFFQPITIPSVYEIFCFQNVCGVTMLTLDLVLSSSIEALESAVESRLCMTHFREGVGEFLSDAQKEATSRIE